MSQQSLSSKTITKRNVAQSSVIFSVVVAMITLGVIGTVAYVDITEKNDLASIEKSIPELIAEQKVRLEENHKKVELLSQAEDLVIKADQQANNLEQLEVNVKKANNQLHFITTNFQNPDDASLSESVQTAPVIHAVKTVQQVTHATNTQKSSGKYQHFINSVFDQSFASTINSNQHMVASGKGVLEFSWLFKARTNMTLSQQIQLQHFLNTQTAWNAKTL